MSGRPGGRGLLLGGAAAVVAAVVAVAFAVLDSPAEERRRRLDRWRVADLQEISGAIDAYWSGEGALPGDLAALAGWQGLDVAAADPVTGAPYRYRVTGAKSYELCATFATESPGRNRRSRRQVVTFWHHPAGEHCFTLRAKRVRR